MKKYGICLILLFLSVSAACVAVGFLAERRSREIPATTAIADTEACAEAAAEEQIAANQQRVYHETIAQEMFYLVAEDGFLLVFLKDQKTICLYTHVPLTDFPVSEQVRLREGIWFPSMMDVFHYLESYTS